MLFRRYCALIVVLAVSVFSHATAPQVTSTSPTSGPTGSQVQINGSGFGSTQGTVKFNAAYSASIVTWSDTQIVVTVPVQAFTGPVLVTAGGVDSNQSVYFNVPAPQVTSISPTSGVVGTQVTVSGSGFQNPKGANSSINFNGTAATVVSWNDTQIVATVAANTSTGAVKVTVNGVASNQDQVFTLPNPIVSGLAPSTGPVGTVVQISGSGFGASQGSSTVQFNGVNGTVTAWSSSSITATVPTTATSGTVLVSVGGVTTSSNVKFTIPPPQVNSVSPAAGLAGTVVTVSGSGFQASKGGSSISINGTTATTSNWSDSQITATIPAGVSSGPVRVLVNGASSNQDVVFTVPNPVISAITPSSGPVGTQVTVTGTGFGATQGSSTLTFQGVGSTVISWSDTQITATVPASAMSGYIQVTVSNVSSHAGDVNFTVPPAHMASISPSSGTTGTQVTITGSGFRSTQSAGGNTSFVRFNGFTASIVSWNDTQIVATVPSTATSGPVTIAGLAGNSNADVVFALPNPTISSLAPSSGPVGTQVQINGSGFGASQGSSIVKFYSGNVASIVSWSDTQIVATVPNIASSGPVTVICGGVTSNTNINFTVPLPQITGISPGSGVVGTQITVSGSGFHASQGSSTVGFTSGLALTVNTWSDTQITATIPSGAVTNPIRVTVNGFDSNKEFLFTLPNPVITAFTPSGGAVGAQIQISGSGFGATQGTSTAAIGTTNISVSTWSDTLIAGTVAAGTASGAVKVTVGGVVGSLGSFNVASLFVNGFAPQAGPVSTSVTVTGNGFGGSQGSSTISFNNVVAAVSGWTDTQIVASVPASATTGPIKVTVGSASNTTSAPFTVGSVVVSSVSPGSGLSGTQAQINGNGFGGTQGGSTVTFNGWSASVVSWSATQITATVPTQATTGAVKVIVGGIASNANVIFNMPSQTITSISPTRGPGGTAVTINGSGFGATQSNSTVSFTGGNLAVSTWSDSVITGTVPSLAQTGAIRVINGAVGSNNNIYFAVPVVQVTSISPVSGVVGTQVTINGAAFRSNQGSGFITFNGTTATIVSWSDTQIVATIPAGARTGPVTANVNGLTSNQDVIFSMPNPVVNSLTPTSGVTGTQVQVTGAGFGATQGSSTLTFHGAAGTITSWSDTSVTATVPSTASSGVVAVTVGGVTSSSPNNFNVPAPQIASISPNRGNSGTQVTITGTGFQSSKGSGNLVFSPLNTASTVSWSDTQIMATVPSNAATGGVWTTVNSVSSNNDIGFTFINPRITGLVPASGPVGTQVQINGSGFGATQGTSTVTMGTTANVVSWSDTQIVATVPATTQSGAVWVTVSGIISNNNINFTVPMPRITSISPSTGTVGTSVTINGSGFQASRGTGSVCFNSACTTNVVSWNDTQIVVAIPSGSTSGAVRVQANNLNLTNQDFVFTMPNPIVTGLAPASGPTGTQVTVNGTGFGATQGTSTITFGNTGSVGSVVSWSDTQIVAIVPAAATSAPVYISEGGLNSNMSVYFNVPTPRITSISPSAGGVGNPVTISGTGFQAVQAASSNVTFVGRGATIKSWSDTQIVAFVPSQTTTGFLDVSVNGIPSNYVTYTIPNQTISTITPSTGPVETQVTVTGTAFGATQGTGVLSFNGQPAESISSWTNTQIVGIVPVTAASGPAVVTVGGINSNTALFTVPAPNLSSFSPLGGVAGTSVTLTGTGFQAHQRDSSVTFNGLPGTVTSWSDTQIVVNVPTSASTGPLLVTVNAVSSPNNSFNVFEVPNPVITAITPPEAPPNGNIVITGTGFGSTGPTGQYPCWSLSNCHVRLNGVDINFMSWSDTSITAQLPSNATSGQLTIVKYDAISAGVPITVEGAPAVTGLAPSIGPVGGSVIISGSGFGATQSTSTAQFNGLSATVSSWSDTQITAVVAPGTATGPVSVVVAGVNGATANFIVNTSVQVTDSQGHSSSYTSAMLGGTWVGTDATGSGCTSCTIRGTIHNDYDSLSNLTAHTDELGRITNNSYDTAANLTASTAHLDANTPVTTSYTYNSLGEPLTVTDPLGNVTTNTYDANGNLLTVTSPAPAAEVAASVTQFAYDTHGQLTQITDPLNHFTTLAYYPTGLIHTITDAQSNVTSYEYDLRGNRTAVVDALQNRTTFAYDLGNRLTGITYPDATSVSFAYDARGRRTSVTDQNGKVTSYAYDDADRLTSVTDAALNVTHYAYDTENNLLSITDANSHITSFTYDAFSRVTQTSFPSGLAETYLYDSVGNLTSKTDRKSQTILYVYDALNRLSHKGYPDATGVDYVYDLAGKMKQASDPTGSYGFAYDNMGRQIGTTTQYSFLPGIAYSNSYGYDATSNRTSFTAPDGSTNTYAYDTLNRLTTLTNSLTGAFGFSYDNLSRRTALNRPNGVNTTYAYDSLSRLLNVLHKAGTVTLDGAGYTYDNAGNRTAKANYLNNITGQYTYDPTYQLTQVTQGTTTTESYSYDAVGNRLSSLGMSPYAYNSSNQLTSTPAATFTYDYNGNTLTKTDSTGTTSYAWDFENRLTSATLPGSAGTVTFKYDAFGRRIYKSSSTSTSIYAYDDANVVEETNASGTAVARYAETEDLDEPLAMLRGGTTSYYEQDALSSVTSLSNTAGALAQTYTFDSFGNQTASSGSFTNWFRFTGREFDTETNLYYMRARYFDPATGRFISEDPSGFNDGANFFRYVRNNPINYTDPLGLTTYKGFPADKEADLRNAVDEALKKLRDTCSTGHSCAGADGSKIANAIQNATFVWKPKQSDCGFTGPASVAGIRHQVGLGPNSFKPICCSLASTVAHEAVHLGKGGDDKAYGVEKSCFGCPDTRKKP